MDSGGERPNDADEKPSEDSEGWYFNLPGGAWERQEEKNRELRERVHSNLDTPSPRADPFAAPKKEEKRGFFGHGKREEAQEEHTTAGGTFRLAKGGFPPPDPLAAATDDDNDWSTEPVVPLRHPAATGEVPLPLPSTEWTAGNDAPGEDILSSMRKWSSAAPHGGQPAAHRPLPPVTPPPAPQSRSSWLEDEDPSAEPLDPSGGEVVEPTAAVPMPPAPMLPLSFRLNRPERAVPVDDDTPSRWKDTFSSSAEETGGLAAMREWAESAPVLPARSESRDEPVEIPAEFLQPFEWETEESETTTPSEIPAELLKPFEWEADGKANLAEPVAAADQETAPSAGVQPASNAGLSEDPWEPSTASEPEGDAFLDDVFPRRTEAPALVSPLDGVQEKESGVFGRLFGRKKQHGTVEGTETPEDAGWLPADEPAEQASGATLPEDSEAELVAEENPWRWPSEPDAADVVEEEPAPAFEVAALPEADAEPVAEENPWQWPTEPDAAIVEEEPAPAFEFAPPPVAEAELAAEENPWRWPAEPAAAVVVEEEPAPAFEFAPPPVAGAELAAEENPWRWPAEPAAAEEKPAPAFEVAALPEAEAELVAEANSWRWPSQPAAATEEESTPAFEAISPAEADGNDADGWDPEPFATPTSLRPDYAFTAAAIESEADEEAEAFSFSFEREAGDEEQLPTADAWESPVALSAPEPADDERPWWESEDEATVALHAPAEALYAAPGGTDVGAPAENLPAPTLLPTADEDPWDQVNSFDSEVADSLFAEALPDMRETIADEWEGFVPSPTAEDAPRTMAFAPEERTFALDGTAFGETPALPGSTPAAPLADPELDLATSLESQMASAEDERLLRTRWDEAAAQFGSETDGSIADVGARYEDDDDVLLRAFNAHASTPEPELAPAIDRDRQRAEDVAFGELLGDGAVDIVAEAADEAEPVRSFLSPTPWVALHRDTPENPFDAPWEPDEGEPLHYRSPATDLRPAPGSGFGSGVPWGTDFAFGDDGAEAAATHSGHNRTKTVVREVVETVMLALLVFLCVRASFQNFKVDGSSMYPTLENGQFLIVNKLVYSEVDMEKLSKFVPLVDAGAGEKRNVFHGPERGDIVVLQDPRKPEIDLIKRVIGLPGETLEIVDGKVYINDFRLDEPYIKAVWHDNKPKILVPPGQYFVMGDNRGNSLDSRSQQVGFVPGDLIIGKALVSYWPKSKFGLAPNEAGNISTQDGVPRLTTQRVHEARIGR